MTNDHKMHLLQLLSVFIWGLLLHAGIGGAGYLQQLANQLASDAQQVFMLAAYIVAVVLAIVSILIFLYPIIKGVHAYRLAGPMGLIALLASFGGGYLLLVNIGASAALVTAAVVLWIVGRSFTMRRSSGA
jgi:hypothetical protein